MSGGHRMAGARRVAALALALALSACGFAADEASAPAFASDVTGAGGNTGGAGGGGVGGAGGFFPQPDVPTPDVFIDAGETDGGPELDSAKSLRSAGKSDDGYLVPHGIALRSAVTMTGTRVAWVERDAPGAPPTLVVWDVALASEGAAPKTFAPPLLQNPSQLALGAKHLFYVDDRYGDADVFALVLATGAELAVSTHPGPQEGPTARGNRVAWQDCRFCFGGPEGREIYQRDMSLGAAGEEERLTDDAVDDRDPAFGTLADGSDALSWVSEDTSLLVRDSEGAIESFPVGATVAKQALSQGWLVYRASPAIINPDSMMPTPIRARATGTGEGVALAPNARVMGDLLGGSLGPVAEAGRAAWIESPPGKPGVGLVVVADIATASEVQSLEVPAVVGVALSESHVAFVAPRADNDGQDDVWILGL